MLIATRPATLLDEARRSRLPVELYVDKDNQDAQRLYGRLGFQRVGENEKDYRMRHR